MYYITKDNSNGTKEEVRIIEGTIEEAFEAFNEIIREQAYQYHVEKSMKTWRIIRLFDENHKQLAQES